MNKPISRFSNILKPTTAEDYYLSFPSHEGSVEIVEVSSDDIVKADRARLKSYDINPKKAKVSAFRGSFKLAPPAQALVSKKLLGTRLKDPLSLRIFELIEKSVGAKQSNDVKARVSVADVEFTAKLGRPKRRASATTSVQRKKFVVEK